MSTAGRTVAFSAVTVALALVTLTVFPLGFLKSMGIAGAVVALVAGAAALVIAPATFAIWGTKLAVKPRGRAPGEQGAGTGSRTRVMRRPLPIALATGALMLVLALPALRARLDAGRLHRDPEGPERAHRRRHRRPRLPRRPGHEPDHASCSARRATRRRRALRRALEELPGRARGERAARAGRATVADRRARAGRARGRRRPARSCGEIRDVRAPYPRWSAARAAEFVDQQDAIGSSLPLAVGAARRR